MYEVPPNILDIESTPSSVAVRENQNINMTCRADGFPTPKIIWRREDGQSITVERKKKVMVYDGEVLHLTKLSRNEVKKLNENSKILNGFIKSTSITLNLTLID